MTLKQVYPLLATGNYTNLQVGSATNITCQTDPIIPNINLFFIL